MNLITKIVLFVIIPLKIMGCSSGYKKVDNKWAWVSYDEGNWGDSTFLEVNYNSFKVLSDTRYGKDDSTVFFEGKPIHNADSKSFRIINKNYAADDSQVYLISYLVFGANSATFKPLRFPFSRDDKTIFCGSVPMKVDDLEHFRVTKSDPSYHIQPMEVFIKENSRYNELDSFSCRYVIIGYGEAKTKTEKFKGFKDYAKK
jgi:hypothetical protein